MLKNNSTLLWVVYGVLFLLLIGWFLLTKFTKEKSSIVFSYPDEILSFAWEQIPLDATHFSVKERFDKEYLLTSNNLYQFYLYVKRYPLYIPYVEAELKKNNIPDDFKYLPIAESALRNNVVSHAWAAGIWQFMPETAKAYWLIVNEHVDERYHFEKSTQAAIEYFKVLYKKFDNWTLVAAAYNRGENGLQRALDDQNVENYYDLYLNEETSRYVFRIMAIKYVMQSYFQKKDFIDRVIGGVYSLPSTQELELSEISDIKQWCLENNLSYQNFRLLNPWVLGNTLPEWNWKIKILSQE